MAHITSNDRVGASCGQTVRWPDNSTLVNVHQEQELQFWARRFRVSRGMLRRAVRVVGPRYQDVQRLLEALRS